MDGTRGTPSSAVAAAPAVYDDFVPKSELLQEPDSDTLLIYLSGFRKEQLRVQLTKGALRISGSRPTGNNRWSRFLKEFPLPDNCDTNKITARFEGGVLFVKQPKLITPTPPPADKQDHNKLPTIDEPQPQQKIPERTTQRDDQAKQTGAGNKEAQEKVEQRPTEGGKKDESVNPKAKGKQAASPDKLAEQNNDLSRVGKKTGDGAKTDNATERRDKLTPPPTAPGNEDGGAPIKTGLASYRQVAGAMRARLKMQRRVVNALLAALFTLLIGLYVSNFIKSSSS